MDHASRVGDRGGGRRYMAGGEDKQTPRSKEVGGEEERELVFDLVRDDPAGGDEAGKGNVIVVGS
jgi:hypothetical protein